MADLPAAILSDEEEIPLEENENLEDEESGDEFGNEFEFGGLLVSYTINERYSVLSSPTI
jgi:hypothetical protein